MIACLHFSGKTSTCGAGCISGRHFVDSSPCNAVFFYRLFSYLVLSDQACQTIPETIRVYQTYNAYEVRSRLLSLHSAVQPASAEGDSAQRLRYTSRLQTRSRIRHPRVSELVPFRPGHLSTSRPAAGDVTQLFSHRQKKQARLFHVTD